MAWRIITSKKIDQDYLAICLRAYGEGRLRPVVDAMKYLRQRLATDPLEAGEPSHRLKHLDLLLGVVIRRPLLLRFAIDEQRQWVYVRGIFYLPD